MRTFQYTVRILEHEVPAAEYLRTCVDVEKFQGFCKACENYGHNWSCPPYDEDVMAVWQGCSALRLYARMLVPDAPGQDAQAAIEAIYAEKQKLLDELRERERAVPGSRGLAAGRCMICPRCARADGAPCRFPERMRPPLEALGADVMQTAARWLGHPVLWIKDGVVPEYLLQVGALLIPKD